jgi:hypothetical protein
VFEGVEVVDGGDLRWDLWVRVWRDGGFDVRGVSQNG